MPQSTAPSPPPSPYRPYETSPLDTPMFYLLVEPCLNTLYPLFRVVYKIRWLLTRPMEIRILPKWIPAAVNVPYINQVPYITIGELLLVLPLIVLILWGYNLSFVSPDLSESGKIASYCLYGTFLSASKSNSVFSFLFGISFERMIWVHLLCAISSILLGCFHTYVAYEYGDAIAQSEGSEYSAIGETPNLGKYLMDTRENKTGTLLLAFLMALVAFSLLPVLRRYCFNIWLISHVILAIAVIVLAYLHEITFILIFAAWWGVDLVLRYIIQAGCKYPARAQLSKLASADIVQVSFPKPPTFNYNAGQFVQICIPAVSKWEFHPISISSAPHEDIVTLHIRGLGNWTNKLVEMAERKEAASIWMEGPYGSLSVDLDDDDRYKMALLVSGGIGVTHCQSVGKSLLHDHTQRGRKLKSLKFVWALRNLEMAHDMQPLGGPEQTTQGSAYTRGTAVTTNGTTSRRILAAQRQSTENGNDSSSQQNKAVVDIDLYCTRKMINLDNDNDVEGQEVSLEPYYNVCSGRPDLDAIFEELKEKALDQGETSIAVFGCGPVPLMVALQEACRKHSQAVVGCDGVFFDLHMEKFEF